MIERELYTILDFLSDMGGVIEIFIIIFSVILAALNYRYPETFAASRLYKISKPSGDHEIIKEDSDSNADQSSFFEPGGSNTRQCLTYCVPIKLLKCCKLSRE